VIRWFWEVVHSLSHERKRKLLAFVTGSDRVPIKGLAHLNPPFVISRYVRGWISR
jgi:ubiquitin-protein ligase E3 A